ncbi:insertion element IS1 protein InsB [Holospora obtusa F1]|uniref:Insertion element IS1 protein InsB n=1 Tax=Holospora obtusa F1 TaxID=1399147 RepID=W6TV98_HOLOB|nr:IS1 family transposase [Holospora obtusa]ETZ07707.1 insertion element IS1 protein InsB [Holospora obtusa F1]
MKCGIFSKKNQKLWIIKAVDRSTRKTVDWVTGNRDAATFKQLYEKVKHLKNCTFYTNDWDTFSKVSTKNRHSIRKSGTVYIEKDHSNTRHHLERMTRRTKVVSKKEFYGVRINQALVCAYDTRNL